MSSLSTSTLPGGKAALSRVTQVSQPPKGPSRKAKRAAPRVQALSCAASSPEPGMLPIQPSPHCPLALALLALLALQCGRGMLSSHCATLHCRPLM